MSTLKQLINKFCPHGVESYVLGELERKNILKLGRGNVISKVEIKNTPGDFPVYSSSVIGDGEIGRYGKYMFDDERITWSIDGGGNFFYRNNLKYSVTNVGGWIKVLDSTILNTKYLYYSLSSSWKNQKYNYIKKAYPSVIRTEYDIPLPPLPVQEEIVKILDKFTDLENELENELRMRKMQFNAYRDKLLTFDNGVRFEKLGDVCKIETGKLNANQSVSNGTYNFFTTSKKITKINTYRWNCEAILLPGNANLENIHYYKGKFNAYQRVYVIHDFSNKINPKFLYYMLLNNFKEYLKGNTNEATILYVVIDIVKKYYFPLPPLEKQKEIVEKLDKFNEMCNEISDGLPLEIELRKKQYEFYRDKLLSFDKKAS